jgi:hypothetical protein
MYFDSFLDIAVLKDKDIRPVIERLQQFSTVYHVDFIVSVSLDEADIPEECRELIV